MTTNDNDECCENDFRCCKIPEAVEARTLHPRCDRRAFARRTLAAGEVILRNAPTAHTLLHKHRQDRCAFCLSTSRNDNQGDSSKTKLLRCGGCKQIWYCSRACQKQDFGLHKVECKQSFLWTETGQTDHHHNSDSGGAMNNARLLVRNFLALRVPRNSEDSSTQCRRVQGNTDNRNNNSIVACGSDHFDNLVEYAKELPLDADETMDIQRAARALWNQRKILNKTQVIIDSVSDLEAQLHRDLRRFRANNFGVTDAMVHVIASAVYPLGALLNHSCAPNCLLRYELGSNSQGRPPVMEIVAAREIPKGEELTHSYVELVSPWAARKATLRDVFGFDCRCERCLGTATTPTSAAADDGDGATRFQISLPNNHGFLSPIQLSRWVLQNYNPSKRKSDSSLASIDQEMILRSPSLDNPNYMAMVQAANAKQQEAQYCMVTGNLDGELAALKEAIRIFESFLAPQAGHPPLSLELYKARCTRFGSLIVAGGELYAKEALIECEHIVAFLCLALKHVPNHSLLGLQLFTLGDVYEANGERDQAFATYSWARRILRISQGNTSDMVLLLNEKLG